MSLTFHQQKYVDVTIHHSKIKRAISSPLEYEFKKILATIGKEGKDWFHQPAYYDEALGLVAVPDFVFIKEQLIIELDGQDHKYRKQKERDIDRDRVFTANDFNIVRIPVPIPKEKESYWRVFILELLKICREELKNQKPTKKSKPLFTKKQFERELKRQLIN